MAAKIIQIVTEFYSKFLDVYVPTYFLWLTEKLNGTNPFAMISISIVLFFLLAIYVWFRNNNA